MYYLYSRVFIKRILASGAIGNLLETYDLILISLMAPTLAKVFFPPASDPSINIINILYVFFLSLLMRPVGNIIMALFADQLGRKKVMFMSLTFTGICSVIIGVLPGYETLGILATIIFILIRVGMNFFAGIEYVNSATYLIENSHKKTSGFFTSWSAMGISGGYLLASFVSFLISYLIIENILPKWGWRLVFLFSLIGIIFGIWIRYSIPESIEFIMNNTDTCYAKKKDILKNAITYIYYHPKQYFSISALTIMGTCLSYIYYIYIPLTIATARNFQHYTPLSINVIALLLVIFLIPLFGRLSDYYNRVILLKLICLFIALLALPFFWIANYGTYIEILSITILISIPASCFFSLYPLILIEKFPSKIRCTASSLVYQIVFSVFLGTLPLLVNNLITITKLKYIPAYLLIFSTLIGYCGILMSQNKKHV